MKKRISLLLGAALLLASTAFSHTLWVTTFESHAHQAGHILTTIGWGHMPPIDDLPQEVALESYTLYDPDLVKTDLPLPEKKISAKIETEKGPTIISGDIGARKLALNENCKPGTYQIQVKNSENYYTHYVDKNGRKKWALKPKDEIADAGRIIKGMLYKAEAVSYFSVGEWTTPKSIGSDLEIVPMTDISNVRVNDLVKFKIFFKGKELSTSPEKSIEYITAVSDSFGGPDKFTLSSMIFRGKGQFRMPTAGRWLVNVYTRQDVTPDGPLKDLVKKCDTILLSSSITFTVKP